jgi:hypothetical protein
MPEKRLLNDWFVKTSVPLPNGLSRQVSTAKPELIDCPWLKIELSETNGAHSSVSNSITYEPGGVGVGMFHLFIA